MRTNIELNTALIDEAQQLAGTRSKRETVDLALRELVARRRQQGILDLVGQGLIADDYDVRQVRDRMAEAIPAGPSDGPG